MEVIIDNRKDRRTFIIYYIIAEIIGLIFLVLVGIWTANYLGGFGWTSEPELEFNLHPLLMSIGMIFLYANSMLVYRSFKYFKKRTLKIVHASIYIIVFLLMAVSLVIAFDSHNLAEPSPVPNMYSLHAWVGMMAIILFCFQLLSGFITYLYPGLKLRSRILLMPFHVYFGVAIFVCAAASALLGFAEKALLSVENYPDLPLPGLLVNATGIVLIIFVALIVFLATKRSFKRFSVPENTVVTRVITQSSEVTPDQIH